MALFALICAIVLLVLYIRLNDGRVRRIPPSISSLSKRVTPEAVKADAKEFFAKPQKDIKAQLPANTGRRYIVVGGVSFIALSHVRAPG